MTGTVADGLALLGHRFDAEGAWPQVRIVEAKLPRRAEYNACYVLRMLVISEAQADPAVVSVQAIECLEAALHSKSALPAAEAAIRLQLSQLLLAHTHNVHEARQHLERAVCSIGIATFNPVIFETCAAVHKPICTCAAYLQVCYMFYKGSSAAPLLAGACAEAAQGALSTAL